MSVSTLVCPVCNIRMTKAVSATTEQLGVTYIMTPTGWEETKRVEVERHTIACGHCLSIIDDTTPGFNMFLEEIPEPTTKHD